MARYPVLEHVGHLEPDLALASQVLQPNFEPGAFTFGAEYPQSFVDFLASLGYEPHDYGNRGMLFASTYGVPMHTDEYPAALWVLGGQVGTFEDSHTFVVGGSHAFLKTGAVYIFDSRKPHGVIAAASGLWVVFSTFIRRKRGGAV